MSKAVEFFKQVSENSALKSTVKAAIEKAATKDEEVQAVAKIAKEAGFDVSAGELKTFVDSALKQSGELSDGELENVAGGLGDLNINVGDVNVTGLVVNLPPGAGDAVGAITGAVDAIGTISDATGAAGIVAAVVPSVISGW